MKPTDTPQSSATDYYSIFLDKIVVFNWGVTNTLKSKDLSSKSNKIHFKEYPLVWIKFRVSSFLFNLY